MHRIGTIDVFPGEMGNNHTLSISPDSVEHGKYLLLATSESDATMLEQTVEMITGLICQESPRAAAESIVARMAWRIAGRLESKNKQIATLCDPNGSAGAWMDDRSIAEDALAAVIKTAQDAEADRKAEEKRKADAKAEADRLERLRLERVAQRVRDLSERGAARRFEEVEAMSDEEFAEAITEADKAVQAEADRKAEEASKIQEEREALERGSQRFRELSALGESSHTIGGLSAAEVYAQGFAWAKAAKAKRDEEDAQREREAQAKRDADRKAQEERDEQDRKERDQRERERVEALKPQREAVIAWANSVIVPALPDIADEDLGEVAACAREDIGAILAKLINRMGGTN